MYFIRVNGSQILSVHDGSKDYVHRLTSQPMPGAFSIPDDCIEITHDEAMAIFSAKDLSICTWDGSNVMVDTAALSARKAALLENDRFSYSQTRKAEIDLLTEQEIDTALQAYGV